MKNHRKREPSILRRIKSLLRPGTGAKEKSRDQQPDTQEGGEKLKIRPARQEDLPRIAEIEKQCFPSPWGAEMFIPELMRENALFLVAEQKNRVAGYVSAYVAADEAHVLKIAVEPPRRREGIGSRLMQELSARARERSAAVIWLEVRESNLAARAFYRRLGFKEAGLRKAYYQDTGENAVIMVGSVNRKKTEAGDRAAHAREAN